MIKRIGKYEVQGELGKGGFGQVLRAYDPTVGRLVAIKVLNATDDKSALNRFRNEATAAGNLHHKNIITIHEFGEDNGLFYLVMEFLEGHDLQRVMANGGSNTLAQKLDIMVQVAEGLHSAHQNGVVHRDVKPANVMVLRDGSVKMMDFGIARLTRDQSTRLTQHGFMIGTVLYMAPEQLSGQEVDALCDIWAYGVMFYELLTGTHPFQAADARVVMFKISTQEPDPISKTVPACPEALEAVMRRLLAKDRDARYQTLEDALFDIEPIRIELRKQDAARFLSEAQELFAQDQLDAAQMMVRRILDLDASNREARLLRERVQQRLRLRNLKPRVEAILKEAEKAIEQNGFEKALQQLESAAKLDAGNTLIQSRIVQVRNLKDQRERAAQPIAEAQRYLELQNLTGAFQQASEALRIDPQNPDAIRLSESIKQELKAREDRYKLQEEQRSAEERREKLSQELTAARELLRQLQFGPAVKRLEELTREHPGEDSISELLAHARSEALSRERTENVEKMGREAWALSKSLQFGPALELLDQGLRHHPDDPVLARLLAAVRSAKAAHEREQAVFKALEECKQLRERGSWEEALRVVERALSEFGEDPALRDLRKEIERDRENAIRADTIRKATTEAKELIEWGRANAAVQVLERTVALYPDDSGLGRLLEATRARDREQEQKRHTQDLLNQVLRLEAARQWPAALGALEKALEKYPDAEDLKAAGERIHKAQAEAEQARKVSSALQEIRKQIERKDWSGARKLVDAAHLDFPGQSAFSGLLDQIHREEHQHEIETVARSIQEQIRQGDLAGAADAASTGLISYPDEPSLRALAEEVRRETICRDGLQAAQGHIAAGRMEEAATALAPVLAAQPYHEEARELLKSIQERQRLEVERRALEAGRAEAREANQRGDFDRAIETINALLKRFPNNQELEQDLRTATASRSESQRKLEEAAALDAARRDGIAAAHDFLRREMFSEAERAVSNLLTRTPGDAELRALLAHIGGERERHQQALRAAAQAAKEQARRNDLRTARDLLQSNRLDEAERCLREIMGRYPADAEGASLLEDLAAARTRAEYSRAKTQADKLVREQQFEAARNVLLAFRQRYPNDLPESDLHSINHAREKHEAELREAARQKSRKDGIAGVREYLRQKKFDEALRAAEGVLSEFPDDAEAQKLASAATTEVQRGQLEEELVQRRAHAEQLLDQGQSTAAIVLLRGVLGKFPGDGPLEQLLKKALVAEERQRADAEFQRWQSLRRAGDAETLQRELTPYLIHHEEPRLRQLLEWADTTLAGARKRKGIPKWAIAAAVVAVASASVVTWRALKPPVVDPPVKHDIPIKKDDPPVVKTDPPPPEVKLPKRPDVIPKKDPPIAKTDPIKKPQDVIVKNDPPIVTKTDPVKDPVKDPPVIKPPELPTGPYLGDLRGKIRWTGELVEGGRVTIGTAGVMDGGGSIDKGLPGPNVEITSVTAGVIVDEAPSAGNQFGRIRLRNNSGHTISLLEVRWHVR